MEEASGGVEGAKEASEHTASEYIRDGVVDDVEGTGDSG